MEITSCLYTVILSLTERAFIHGGYKNNLEVQISLPLECTLCQILRKYSLTLQQGLITFIPNCVSWVFFHDQIKVFTRALIFHVVVPPAMVPQGVQGYESTCYPLP